MKEMLLKMITSKTGGISSKIILGGICYILLIIAVAIKFCMNDVSSEIFNTCVITSATLLGLTTVENVKQ